MRCTLGEVRQRILEATKQEPAHVRLAQAFDNVWDVLEAQGIEAEEKYFRDTRDADGEMTASIKIVDPNVTDDDVIMALTSVFGPADDVYDRPNDEDVDDRVANWQSEKTFSVFVNANKQSVGMYVK